MTKANAGVALGGATVYAPSILMSSSFWYTWLYIAIEHEHEAREVYEAAPSGNELGDAIGRDTRASLIAIVAAAHSIDALYGLARGAVPRELRAAWDANRMNRSTRIRETLRLAFHIDAVARARSDDLDWLFQLRNEAVHFEEESRPVVAHPLGTNTAVENEKYSMHHASRAVDLALDLSEACITSAKPAKAFASWGARHAPGFDRLRQFRKA